MQSDGIILKYVDTSDQNIAFQAITPSHSVPANVQNVLSMMKTHNPKLCGGSLSKSIGSHAKSPRSGYTSSGYFRYVSNST